MEWIKDILIFLFKAVGGEEVNAESWVQAWVEKQNNLYGSCL